MATQKTKPCIWCKHDSYHIPGGVCMYQNCKCSAFEGTIPGMQAKPGMVVTVKNLYVVGINDGPAELNIVPSISANAWDLTAHPIKVDRSDVIQVAIPPRPLCTNLYRDPNYSNEVFYRCGYRVPHDGLAHTSYDAKGNKISWEQGYTNLSTVSQV